MVDWMREGHPEDPSRARSLPRPSRRASWLATSLAIGQAGARRRGRVGHDRTADNNVEEIMNLLRMSAWLAFAVCMGSAQAQTRVTKTDMQIDGLDPGIKIFLREKMPQGNTRFTNDNVVLFLHGATSPSACDFDLQYKDYSWADWLVTRGYVVYMGDYRNYGGSTREKAMDEPAAKNQPVTRSYLALRDIEAMVNHIKRTRNVEKVTLIG